MIEWLWLQRNSSQSRNTCVSVAGRDYTCVPVPVWLCTIICLWFEALYTHIPLVEGYIHIFACSLGPCIYVCLWLETVYMCVVVAGGYVHMCVCAWRVCTCVCPWPEAVSKSLSGVGSLVHMCASVWCDCVQVYACGWRHCAYRCVPEVIWDMWQTALVYWRAVPQAYPIRYLPVQQLQAQGFKKYYCPQGQIYSYLHVLERLWKGCECVQFHPWMDVTVVHSEEVKSGEKCLKQTRTPQSLFPT